MTTHLKLWIRRRNAESSSSTAWITRDSKCPHDPERTAGAVSDFSPRVYTSKDPLRGALQVDTLLSAVKKSRRLEREAIACTMKRQVATSGACRLDPVLRTTRVPRIFLLGMSMEIYPYSLYLNHVRTVSEHQLIGLTADIAAADADPEEIPDMQRTMIDISTRTLLCMDLSKGGWNVRATTQFPHLALAQPTSPRQSLCNILRPWRKNLSHPNIKTIYSETKKKGTSIESTS